MQYTFKLRDGNSELTIVSKPLNHVSDEGRVLHLLRLASMEAKGEKVSKSAIMKVFKNMGSHECHEAPSIATTRRRAHQVIRNLRDLDCPIISDRKGSWIARSVYEVEEFAKYLEKKAKSDICSMMRLRKTMLNMVASKTPSLFDKILKRGS